ncbi:LAMI_0F09384g1_1 [Lachancea mirantina]|uniref:LAMI_0F09384g1_1 n=1 Tax=Lachancea mirantina TaxID=1230905 RepID=A0A1G4K138_9SACH|nr:LAMI_0F09384g1_1 [Lachancea mirantina]
MSASVEQDAVDLEARLSPRNRSGGVLRENLKSFAAGGVGGVSAVLTGHPFDLIKVRCQAGHASGTFDAVGAILRESRAQSGPVVLNAARGFYRGVVPPLLGVTPIFAVSFWGYDVGKKLVHSVSSPDSPSTSLSSIKLSTGQMAAAGFISAIPTTLVTAPTERIKVVLQTSHDSSFIGAARRIVAEGGIQSLFRGTLATLARDGPGSALYFASYEVCKHSLSKGKNEDELSVANVCIAGGVAGVSMWLGVFPIDTLKTKLQSGSGSMSMTGAAREIYVARGIKGFFPGVGPALLRSFPANAATFLGVELTHALFRKYNV